MNAAKGDVVIQTRQFLEVLAKLSEPKQAALARFLAKELPRLANAYQTSKRASATSHASRIRSTLRS